MAVMVTIGLCIGVGKLERFASQTTQRVLLVLYIFGSVFDLSYGIGTAIGTHIHGPLRLDSMTM